MRAVRVASLAVCLLSAAVSARADDHAMSCAGIRETIAPHSLEPSDADASTLARLATDGCSDPALFLLKGLIHRQRHEYPQAIDAFQRGLALDPTNVPLRLELAITYAWSNRLNEALATYRSVLDRDPGSAPARAGEARILGWIGHRKEAAEKFARMIEENPGNIEALAGLAAVHAASLNARLARLYYERVLAIDPNNRDAREGRQRVDTISRLELSASITAAGSPLGARNAAGLSLSYRLNPDFRLLGGYNAVPRDPVLDRIDLPTGLTTSEWRLGIDRRMNRSTSAGAEFKSLMTDRGALRSVSAEASRTLRPRLALFGGIRPSVWKVDGVSLLGWTGASIAWTPGMTLALQVFRGASRGGTSEAFAVTVRRGAGAEHELSATVGVGQHGAVRSVTAALGVRIRTSRAGDVRLEYAFVGQPNRSNRLSVLANRRF